MTPVIFKKVNIVQKSIVVNKNKYGTILKSDLLPQSSSKRLQEVVLENCQCSINSQTKIEGTKLKFISSSEREMTTDVNDSGDNNSGNTNSAKNTSDNTLVSKTRSINGTEIPTIKNSQAEIKTGSLLGSTSNTERAKSERLQEELKNKKLQKKQEELINEEQQSKKRKNIIPPEGHKKHQQSPRNNTLNGNQAKGNQANGDQANDNHANGNQANDNHANGDQANDNHANGDQANDNHVNGDQANTCCSEVKEFFFEKGIVILGIFIGLGNVQHSSKSSFQTKLSNQKALNI